LRVVSPVANFRNRSSLGSIAVALGVGQDEYAIPDMRCTNGNSRYAMPFRVIPDLGQFAENAIQPPSKQRCDVLQQDISWLQFSNHANGLEKQS
jgi:hypothetical protein